MTRIWLQCLMDLCPCIILIITAALFTHTRTGKTVSANGTWVDMDGTSHMQAAALRKVTGLCQLRFSVFYYFSGGETEEEMWRIQLTWVWDKRKGELTMCLEDDSRIERDHTSSVLSGRWQRTAGLIHHSFLHAYCSRKMKMFAITPTFHIIPCLCLCLCGTS